MDSSRQEELFQKFSDTLDEWSAQDADAQRGQADQLAKMKEGLDALIDGTTRYREGTAGLAQRMAGDLKALREAIAAEAGSGQEAEQRAGELEQALTEAREEAAKLQQSLAESTEAAQAAQQRVGKLERELAGANERADALEQREADGRTQADDLTAKLEEAQTGEKDVTLDLEATLSDLAEARKENERLREAGTDAEEIQEQLEAERQRADALDEKLRGETAKGTKSALAAQLADALGENETLQDEVRGLRNELKNAGGEAGNKAPATTAVRPATASKGRGSQRRDVGEILVESGVVTQDQLDAAREAQRKSPQHHLGAILVEQELASEDAVGEALASACNVPFIRLGNETIDPASVKLLSSRLAKLHTCIPLRTEGNRLILAMENPGNLVAVEDIERSTSLAVEPMVATPTEITAAIEESYGEKKAKGKKK